MIFKVLYIYINISDCAACNHATLSPGHPAGSLTIASRSFPFYALQTLWLTPQTGPAQTVNVWSLGAPQKLFDQPDAFGNTVSSYTFTGQSSLHSGSNVPGAATRTSAPRAP